MFKVCEDISAKHLIAIAFAGVIIFVSLLQQLMGPSRGQTEEVALVQRPYVESGQTRYKNPKMSWYEKFLCRGFQRSGACNYRLIHPFSEVFEQNGVQVEQAPPRKEVINYRGPLKVNRAISGHITLEDELSNW